MTTDDPVARLSAGLAEDERIARAAAERAAEWKEMDAAVVGGPFTPAEPEYLIEESGEHTIVYREGYPLKPEAQHIARQNPRATLRRVEAIRKVIEIHSPIQRFVGRTDAYDCNVCVDDDHDSSGWPCPTLRLLADIYPEGHRRDGEAVITEYLITRWPDIFGEPQRQREANIAAGGMKPEWMSWGEWCDIHRSGYFGRECHWYDPPEHSGGRMGSCRGDLLHNHQPRLMRWYWASPLSWIIPPLYFLWESGGSIGLSLVLSLGNHRRTAETENP